MLYEKVRISTQVCQFPKGTSLFNALDSYLPVPETALCTGDARLKGRLHLLSFKKVMILPQLGSKFMNEAAA